MPKRKRRVENAAPPTREFTPSTPMSGRSSDISTLASPASKRRKAFDLAPHTGTHILCLFVGEQHVLITLHTDLMSAKTKDYLNNRFAMEQVCWLREEDPSIASLWRLYLYTGHIFSDDKATDQEVPDTGDEESHADGEWTKLAHAYLFGRKVQDEGFANACVTALIEKVQESERFPTGIAGEVYKYTSPGDKLRKLLVHLHVCVGRGECLKPPHEDADAPMEFHRNVRGELRRAGDAVHGEHVPLWETDRCAYHTHVSTRICEA